MVHKICLLSIALAACLVAASPRSTNDKTVIYDSNLFATLTRRGSDNVGNLVGEIVGDSLQIARTSNAGKKNPPPDSEKPSIKRNLGKDEIMMHDKRGESDMAKRGIKNYGLQKRDGKKVVDGESGKPQI